MIAIRRPHWTVSSLLAAVAACMLATTPARGQTYTSPNSGIFTNVAVWNFGANKLWTFGGARRHE